MGKKTILFRGLPFHLFTFDPFCLFLLKEAYGQRVGHYY